MRSATISLIFNWKYSPNFKKEFINPSFNPKLFENVSIPHTNIELPHNYFDEKQSHFVSCYRKDFRLSKKYKDKRIFVDFEGVMTHAKVYLNGKEVGINKGGYTPFSFEITEFIHFDKKNILVVKVDSSERKDIPPFGGVIDYLTYGGIYRDVNIRIVDKIFIENLFITPKDVLKSSKRLDYKFSVNNSLLSSEDLNIKALIKFKNKIIETQEKQIQVHSGLNEFDFEFKNLKNIKLWNLESPNLYSLKLILASEKFKIEDSFEEIFGFREAKFTTKGFFLNGQKIKLIGLNRHQSFPYVGYAMPKRIQEKDADILKDKLHTNIVRTSHYPQSKHFLNRCDEIGLLVFEEIPGWQHVGDENWQNLSAKNVEDMIKRDYNHPSIVLWGVRINESNKDYVEFYKKTNEIAHKLDTSRQTGGVRTTVKDDMGIFQEDVFTVNDFTYEGKKNIIRKPKDITKLKRNVPYLITEFNGHVYPTKRFDNEDRQIEHTLRHAVVQNSAGENDNISGAIGWCAFDYNTHNYFGSGDRICYHGVMDIFRIPKLAAYFYKSQVDPKKESVLEPITFWTPGERNYWGVSPFDLVICTNCDYVVLFFDKNNIGKYFPDKVKFKGLEYPPIIIKDLNEKLSKRFFPNVEFRGYVNGKFVKDKRFVNNPIPKKLIVSADNLTLSSKIVDTTRIIVKVVDQIENTIPFFFEPIDISIKGPGKIIGPNSVSLIAGALAFWVKTIGKKGKIKIEVSSKIRSHLKGRVAIKVI